MKNLLLVSLTVLLIVVSFAGSCTKADKRIPVIFDTDANNELDDQHALAYLLFNAGVFDTKAITVNATSNGGNIDEQYAEALRIVKLCKDNVFLLGSGIYSIMAMVIKCMEFHISL